MGIVQRDSFRITLISYTGAALGYLNKIILFTNFLTTEQVGLANLLVTISVLYAQVASLGSYNIVLRFFPYFQNKSHKHHGFLFGMIMLTTAGFIMATTLFLLLQKPFQYVYGESSPLLTEYALYIVPMAMATLYYQLFEAYLRSLHKNIIPSVVQELILRIAIAIAIFIFAVGVIDFHTFVTVYVLANCFPACIIILYTAFIRQLFVVPLVSTPLKRLGRIIILYGLFSLFNNLSFIILSSIDSLMVAGMIDLGSAGIYTTMIFITSVMLIPYRSINRVAGPLIAAFWKKRAMMEMQDLYRKASASNLVIGGMIFILLWVNLDTLFMLMPGEYMAGKTVFLFLGMGKLFDMASGLNGTILLTSRKYHYDLFFTAGLIAFTVISNLVFIPLMGMNGAAMASMLTMILFNLLRIIFIKRHFKLHPFEIKDILPILIMALIMFISHQIPPADSVITDVVLRSFSAMLVFIIPVYLLKVSPDINRVIDVFKKSLFH